MGIWKAWVNFTKKPSVAKFLLNIYPPYLGAGIRVKHISQDFREVIVQMSLRFFNRNYVGTHFGGSMYAMVDPFYMLMLFMNLGADYIVWDSAAEIKFLKPARGKIKAVFKITEEDIQKARKETEDGKPYFPVFYVDIVDESGQVVANVKKVLYVRRKKNAERKD